MRTDHRGSDEPLCVADGVKEPDGLLHLVRVLILDNAAVVPRQRDSKEDSRDVLEAVDPFLPLGALTAHVEDSE